MANGYNDRNDSEDRSESEVMPPDSESTTFHDGPEPPIRWNPSHLNDDEKAPDTELQQPQHIQRSSVVVIGSTRFTIRNDEINEFESARRYMTAAQVIAVLSLFLGSVMLSALALVCAFAANTKLNSLAMAPERNTDVQKALKRAGIMAIAIAAIALLLNILAITFLYPYVAEVMQSGSFGSLTSALQPNIPSNTTWG